MIGYHVSTSRISEVDLNKAPTGFWLVHEIESLNQCGACLEPGKARYIHKVTYNAANAANRDDYEKRFTAELLQQGKQVVILEDSSTIIDANCIQEIEILKEC